MTDRSRPTRVAPSEAFAQLENAARRELTRLATALPSPAPPADPLLAHLAWDLGLSGQVLQDTASAPSGS